MLFDDSPIICGKPDALTLRSVQFGSGFSGFKARVADMCIDLFRSGGWFALAAAGVCQGDEIAKRKRIRDGRTRRREVSRCWQSGEGKRGER